MCSTINLVTDTSSPTIPVIALLDMSPPDLRIGDLDPFRSLNKSLKEHCSVRKCETPEQLYHALIVPPRPQAVFIFEPSVIQKRKYDHLATVLADYAKSGGRVVIGGICSSLVTAPRLDTFFHSKLQVPWALGDSFQTVYHLNHSHHGLSTPSLLAWSSPMKALHIQNVKEEDALYVPSPESRTANPSMMTGAPIAMCKVGEGWLGWHGDFNHTKDMTLVHLAMLGVPITKPLEKLIRETR